MNQAAEHYLSDFLVAELTERISLAGKAYNASTSYCMTPGEEDFELNIRGELAEPLTATVARHYQQLGLTTRVMPGNPGGVTVKKDSRIFKQVTITMVPGSDHAIISVRLY